jgi:hypothetical protein
VKFDPQVEAFLAIHPRATRRQWAEFATSLAEEAKRAGYELGWAECEGWVSNVDPETIADELSPGWRERPYDPLLGVEAFPMDDVVPDARTGKEELDAIRERVGERQFGY